MVDGNLAEYLTGGVPAGQWGKERLLEKTSQAALQSTRIVSESCRFLVQAGTVQYTTGTTVTVTCSPADEQVLSERVTAENTRL